MDAAPEGQPLPPDIEAALGPPRRKRKRKRKKEPEALTPKQRGLRIIRLAAYRNAAEHGLLTELRKFDLEQGWKADGATSCAAWLAWRTGEKASTCRAKLFVAHKLAEFEHIDEAFRRGELSYTQVRALLRRALPGTERVLVELSRRLPGGRLERALKWIDERVASDLGPPSPDQLRLWFEKMPNNVVDLHVKLLPEQQPLVENALRAVKEAACGKEAAPSMSDNEAFMGVIDLALESELLKARTPVLGKYEALVSVDAEVLKRQMREPLERCEVQGQRPVSAATALRLTCSSATIPFLVLPDGSALDVGRRTRRVSRALMARLIERDRHCRFPGCTNRLFLDAHHMKHWAQGGSTTLDNLCLTCRRHHRIVHEGGFTARMVGGEPLFFDRAGNLVAGEREVWNLGQDPLDTATTGIEELPFHFSLLPRHVAAWPRLREVVAQVTRESLDLLVPRAASA
jgi:hypothetical protein